MLNNLDQNDVIENADIPVAIPTKPNIFSFIKKHWLVISITAAVILLFSLLFLYLPVININKTKLVNLDTLIRIESGENAKLKLSNVSVKIKHFTNDDCPKSVTCFGSAKGVEYTLTVDGQDYAIGSLKPENKSGYKIITESTDYKTYSTIKIVKS